MLNKTIQAPLGLACPAFVCSKMMVIHMVLGRGIMYFHRSLRFLGILSCRREWRDDDMQLGW